MVGLIAGPTASGKTALALHLATTRNVVTINADSAQVYSDLPVLSAQPSPAELQSAPHQLFGYLDGRTACSAARWAADAQHAITEAHNIGALPLLVGGSGLYIRTLSDGIAPIPEIDADLRASIRAMPVEQAYADLTALDPDVAKTLAPSDISRISRALEVIRGTGRSIAEWRKLKTGGIGHDIDLRALLLLPPREWLYARCDARFEAMLANGAVNEVKALLARKLPQDAPVMRAIGVPEIAGMLEGRLSADDAAERGKIATRQYAKRQFTWFRNQGPSQWTRFEHEINVQNIGNFGTIFQ